MKESIVLLFSIFLRDQLALNRVIHLHSLLIYARLAIDHVE